jgi:hypothetical protein
MYLSHAPEDEALALAIARSLSRIGAEPYFPSRTSTIQTNNDQINDSNCFIPILTENGFKSPYVNQELGYATARKNLGLFPFVEKSQSTQTISRSTEIIEFDPNNLNDAIYHLISAVRDYVGRNEWIELTLGFVTIHCRRCGRCYTESLPSQEAIAKAIEAKESFVSNCVCNTINYYSPKTFLVSS